MVFDPQLEGVTYYDGYGRAPADDAAHYRRLFALAVSLIVTLIISFAVSVAVLYAIYGKAIEEYFTGRDRPPSVKETRAAKQKLRENSERNEAEREVIEAALRRDRVNAAKVDADKDYLEALQKWERLKK